MHAHVVEVGACQDAALATAAEYFASLESWQRGSLGKAKVVEWSHGPHAVWTERGGSDGGAWSDGRGYGARW